MKMEDLRSINDLEQLLDNPLHQITVFGGRRYYTISKRNGIYLLYNSGKLGETPYTSLETLLIQLIMTLAQECE